MGSVPVLRLGFVSDREPNSIYVEKNAADLSPKVEAISTRLMLRVGTRELTENARIACLCVTQWSDPALHFSIYKTEHRARH
jgi:hypothetical protein